MSRSSYHKNISIIILSIIIISCTPQQPKKTYVITQQTEQKNTTYIQTTEFPYEKFNLTKTQNYELEEKFRNIVEESYEETYKIFGINFNYSLIPEGVIYPYSDITIKCITDSKNLQTEQFKKNCNYFFTQIKNRLTKIKGAP
ncbi:MAG: hypothetical protein N2505_06020 [Endomicrobia bacterium]|nr:hypothetical protein [Endomicrobiia bacterium]